MNAPPSDKLTSKKGPVPTVYTESLMHDLASAVAHHLNSTVEAMRSLESGANESHARVVAMAAACALYPSWDREKIGKFFRREKSDATFCAKRVSRAIQTKSGTPLHACALKFCKAYGIEPEKLMVKS